MHLFKLVQTRRDRAEDQVELLAPMASWPADVQKEFEVLTNLDASPEFQLRGLSKAFTATQWKGCRRVTHEHLAVNQLWLSAQANQILAVLGYNDRHRH